MKKTVFFLVFLATAGLMLLPSIVSAQVGARIWLENEPDYFRRGDRMDVGFSVSDDAYVAVVHVDSDGNLDFVYPESPWDNEFIRGGRMHRLSPRGGTGWMVRGRPGIGYFYIIASPQPLDFSYFRGRSGSPWDWGYAGRAVHGDPFIAFDQIARMLLSPYAPYVFDYYSYYVEGLHRYPTYACSSNRYDYGWGWTPSYGACGQLDYFLRDHPYYYDTRRYRGDRQGYLREYDRLDPRHGYKEAPDRRPARGITPRDSWQGQGSVRDEIPRRPSVEPEPTGGRGTVNEPPRRTAEPRSGSTAPQPRERPAPDLGTRRAPADAGTTTERRPARGRP